MSWNDGKVPPKDSPEGRRLERMVYQNRFLKQMRAKSHGETASDISTAPSTEAYKSGYDQIDWSAKPDTPRSFRLTINGKTQTPDSDQT